MSFQVQAVLILAPDNSNMNAGNVTKLHTFATQNQQK